MGFIRCEGDKIVIVSSMIKRRIIGGSLKVMPEIVEAFVLYRKHVIINIFAKLLFIHTFVQTNI